MKKIFIILVVWVMSFSAYGTVLIFNNADGSLVGAYGLIPQAYGDYVAAAVQNGFGYGEGSHGWTPDVNVSYPIRSGNVETLFGWDYGYSGLVNVAYPWLITPGSYDDIEITFQPRNGKAVRLHSFDMGSYNGGYNLAWNVKNSVGQVLTSGTVYVTTAAPSHVVIDSNTAISSAKLILTVYTSFEGANAPNLAIDNIEFSEAALPPGQCGDESHPILLTDFNGDCQVNFEDFAILVLHWTECTNPNPPCNYLP